jgi:PD-(D/E)XK nuclease superfamily
MAVNGLNKLTSNLAEICKGRVFQEKWLIAPTLRVGFQWIDQITRSGVPVVNVRVKTLAGVVLELAYSEMEKHKVEFVGRLRSEIIIDQIFSKLKAKKEIYLTTLEPSPGLTKSIARTVNDLRLSGLTKDKLSSGAFEVSDKGKEIKSILTEYENNLQADKFIDYADALRFATAKIKASAQIFDNGILLVIPDSSENSLNGLEKLFFEAIPEKNIEILETDSPQKPEESKPGDRALLGWIQNPTIAPKPHADKTATMFRAVSEINEVRNVLRICMEKNIAFDEVELIHTDYSAYVPLVYEVVSALNKKGPDSLPVTCSEGIPARYSRPARALLGWLTWIKEDYPQSVLVQMVFDGLLNIQKTDDLNISNSKMGTILKSVPIGGGQTRYIEALENQITSLKIKLETPSESERKTNNRKERLAALNILKDLTKDLFTLADVNPDENKILENTKTFLQDFARSENQIDEYSLHSFMASINEMSSCLPACELKGVNITDWLMSLPLETTVSGLGPRPGCIFVSPLKNGGHSGRKHTFIVGLDDGRFPGSGTQDPLLLDHERKNLSDELPTSSGSLDKKTRDFAKFLAGLRGNVTLSYCCRDIADDREMFPSPVILSAYRILSGNMEGALNELTNWLPPPASFAPNGPHECIDKTDWWLWRMCQDKKIKNPEKTISKLFSHLDHGFKARDARNSDKFTEYDGYVPDAAKDCDPTTKNGPLMSASRLEKLAQCPYEYFLKYVLEIEVPEEYGIDTEVWLGPLEKGSLLHEVFRAFMTKLSENKKLPAFDRDISLLLKILSKNIEKAKLAVPPPSKMVMDQEITELGLIARVFLKVEEEHCKNSAPLYFEAALGMRQDGKPTPLDSYEPVKIKLPSGKTIRGRGQIDRIDEVFGSDQKLFEIWDYKTGSAWKYRQGPPFWGGRCIQNYFYLALVQARLSHVHHGAKIKSFGYFFPGLKEHGERIFWDTDILLEGQNFIGNLCEMLATGCFPMTDNPQDINYSDYIAAFGDIKTKGPDIIKKLENTDDKILDPFRKLRGHIEGGK